MEKSPRSLRSAAFTLVELLVVIAIIGVLVALLLPAVQSAREASRRSQCANHLHQLSAAAHNYHSARREFPHGLNQFEVNASPRFRGTSLFTYLLPFIEEGQLLSGWDYQFPMKNSDGGPTARTATVVRLFLCPSDLLEKNPVDVAGRWYGLTSYGGNGGTRSVQPELSLADGTFHTTGPASEPQLNQRPVRIKDITDGSSHTLLLGERSHHDLNLPSFIYQSWGESLDYLGRWAAIGGRQRIGDVTMSAYAPINYRIPFTYENRSGANPPADTSQEFNEYMDRRFCAYGSEHPSGANFALADGSVRFVADALPQDLLRSISTRAGGEATSSF
jgi:prepilin-type N-terminal cleavage/methylation domain-containing protein/prepilin-type processing-associated H-X9-DG protein